MAAVWIGGCHARPLHCRLFEREQTGQCYGSQMSYWHLDISRCDRRVRQMGFPWDFHRTQKMISHREFPQQKILVDELIAKGAVDTPFL
jgi:hypothetical protein